MTRRTALFAAAFASCAAFAADPLACAPAPRDEPAPERLVVPAGTRVGLALGSGSLHGLAHVGVIQELEARGLEVGVVAGTSIGAVVGALWASGLDGRKIEALARDDAFEAVASFAGSWQGLFSNAGMQAPLEEAFRRRPIEAWPRRFGAVATNIANGERRLLVRGSGAAAVQASSAVPIFYLPVVVAGERLVDGALVEPVPVEAARDLGASFVIAVDVAYRPHEEAASGMTQYAFQAMHILLNSLAARQIQSADVAIRLNLHQRFTACGRDALVAAGREAMRRAWPEIAIALARSAPR